MVKMKEKIEKIIGKKIINKNVNYQLENKGKKKYQWKSIELLHPISNIL